MFHALHRLPILLSALGLTSLLGACSTGQFMQQYLNFDNKNTVEKTPYCPKVKDMTAKDLYGDWALELTQMRLQGDMRLSQHPEFSDSLRGHIQYGPVKAIASGDVKDGNFDLDESADGKRLTATWSGSLPAGDCGRIIRGTWTELDTNLKSSFVLRRLSPLNDPKASAAPAVPATTGLNRESAQGNTASPTPSIPAARTGQAPATTTSTATHDDQLPVGVQVMPVPDPGHN